MTFDLSNCISYISYIIDIRIVSLEELVFAK
jgi:hypothetical protein